ncbi:hypothetical protein [Pseudomonas sp. dw_358]|uniref:hypothetical protein n=1 Tax=Pseudomonas sp. dw_358 TaxID=2720083 RepID=UPI001BD51A19|nr:hypothetical protein [Pseudomonas sp. dw_358]
MKVVIKAVDIPRTDFSAASEIWVAPLNAALAADNTDDGLCLWRGTPVVTHDMLSEGTHEQNLRRIWLQVPHTEDKQAVEGIEQALRARLQAQQLSGEFYPAQRSERFEGR